MIRYKRHIHFPSGPINFMDQNMKDDAFKGDLGSQILWFKSEWNEYVDALCYDCDLRKVISEALDVIGCLVRFPAITEQAREFLESQETNYCLALMMHIKQACGDIDHKNIDHRMETMGTTYYQHWAEKQKLRKRHVLEYQQLCDEGLPFVQIVLDDHLYNEAADAKHTVKNLLKEIDVLEGRIKTFEAFIYSLGSLFPSKK